MAATKIWCLLRGSGQLIAFSVALACPARAQWSESEYNEILQYFETYPTLATAAEQQGDAAAAAGNNKEALDDYARALEYTAYSPTYLLQIDHGETTDNGLQLAALDEFGSIYQAGLRDGDIVTAIDGKSTAGMSRSEISILMMSDAIAMQVPGEGFKPSTFTILRGNQTLNLTPPGPEIVGSVQAADRPNALRLLNKEMAIYASTPIRPPVPWAARQAALKAASLAKSASNEDGVQKAAVEYEKASFTAPWWSDLYINYALFQKASNDAVGARRSLNFFLMLEPNGADAPGARKLLAELDPAAAAQAKLDDWTGWWAVSIDGVPQNTGMTIERKGTMLFVRNGPNLQPWLRATIIDDNTAKDVQRFSKDTGANFPGALDEALQNCFNGVLENSGTMTLSPDRKHLTAVNPGVPYIDASTCAMTATVPETVNWVKTTVPETTNGAK